MATNTVRRAMDPLRTRSFPLWFGTLGPPLAWASHLLASDAIFELGCSAGFTRAQIYGLPLPFWALLETAVALAVDVAAGLLAWGAFRRLRAVAAPPDTRWNRASGMAVAGMASSLIYGLILVYGLLPTFFLTTCRGSI